MESRNSCQLLSIPMADLPTIASLDWVQSTAGYLQRSDLPDSLQTSTDRISASVLIPLFLNENQWQVLFIRRMTNERDRHSGQVAFPGGRRDPQDADDVAVALREAHEEIGLQTSAVEVIHELPAYQTSSNYVVTPVVGIVPWPYAYRAQPTEVSRIFSIPLKWLADENNVELRAKEIPNTVAASTVTRLKVVYYNKYDGELLWGASARMTVSLLKAILTGEINLQSYTSQR